MNSFAAHFESILREHSKNLTALARKAGISRPSLYDLINGKNLPRTITLENLIAALDLSDKSAQILRDEHRSERLRTTRKEQEKLHKEKKSFLSQVSEALLRKGHEISLPKDTTGPDLVLRLGSLRIPLLVTPAITDHPSTLGHLLAAMHNLSASRGYACIPKLLPADRTHLTLYAKHGVKILTQKNLLREIN